MVSRTDPRSSATGMSVQQLAKLRSYFLSDRRLKMLIPARVEHAHATPKSAVIDRLELTSPEFGMGTANAAVLAVSRQEQIGLVQLASGHHVSRTVIT